MRQLAARCGHAQCGQLRLRRLATAPVYARPLGWTCARGLRRVGGPVPVVYLLGDARAWAASGHPYLLDAARGLVCSEPGNLRTIRWAHARYPEASGRSRDWRDARYLIKVQSRGAAQRYTGGPWSGLPPRLLRQHLLWASPAVSAEVAGGLFVMPAADPQHRLLAARARAGLR